MPRWGLRSLWLVLIAAAGIFRCFFRPVVVVGDSMSPALRSGCVVWMRCRHVGSAPPRSGDVVVFREEGITHIKRVVGTCGQTIEMVKCWNDTARPISTSSEKDLALRRFALHHPGRARLFGLRMASDAVYVMGDNMTASVDSRDFGPVPLRALEGEVVFPHVPPPVDDHYPVRVARHP